MRNGSQSENQVGRQTGVRIKRKASVIWRVRIRRKILVGYFDEVHPPLVCEFNVIRIRPVIELHGHSLFVHCQHRCRNTRVSGATVIVNDPATFADLIHCAAQFHTAIYQTIRDFGSGFEQLRSLLFRSESALVNRQQPRAPAKCNPVVNWCFAGESAKW